MTSVFPDGLDTFATNHADGVSEVIAAARVNELADAVNKIEPELLFTPELDTVVVPEPVGGVATPGVGPGAAAADHVHDAADLWALSGEETMPPGVAQTTSLVLLTGVLYLTYFRARMTGDLTNVQFIVGDTGSTPTLLKVGLYSVDPLTGALALVANTATDTTHTGAASTVFTKALAAAYTRHAGAIYAVGLLQTGTTCTVLSSKALANLIVGRNPRMTGLIAGQADLPTTLTDAALSASVNAQYFYLS